MVFSISALQGQTVTQRPHETQLDSPMGEPPSHSTRGLPHWRVELRFIDFDVLTCLYAAATEDALIGIVAIERVGVIDFVRFRSERDSLMLNGQQFRRVMDRAI